MQQALNRKTVAAIETEESVQGAETEIAELKRRIRTLEQDIEKLKEEKAEIVTTLDNIVESKSWKLITGYRNLKNLLLQIWPLFRFSINKVTLVPEQDISAEGDGSFSISGPGPQFSLVSDGGLKGGWSSFEGKLASGNPHQHFFLYWDDGSGFQTNRRALILLEKDRVNKFLVKLPRKVNALRLDPFDTEGKFSLEELKVRGTGSVQVAAALFKKHAGSSLKDPAKLFYKFKRLYGLYREGGLLAIRIRLFSDEMSGNYTEWCNRYDTLTEEDREKAKGLLESFDYRPLISIVMPVYNVEEQYLREAIESVRDQWYPEWELCIADDASTLPHIKKVLEEYKTLDSRIQVTYRKENGHISKASNSALSLATGEYVALFDNDDVLRPHALLMVVSELNKNRDLKFIYSDEDKITPKGMRFNPYFKSGWNPVLLLTQNYICHLTVIKNALIHEAGGFRAGFEGAQDWDLILRSTERLKDEEICHIPHVLYHWRVIESSTAHSTGSKPYVLEAQRRAVTEHLMRKGVKNAEVEILENISQLRVTFPLPEDNPLVSLIIPTRDAVELVKQCVDSILKETTYKNYEIIIVDNGSERKETFQYFDSLKDLEQVRVLRDDGTFNFSRLNNRAVAEAQGEFVGLINNDLEVINPDWLSELLSCAVLPGTGAVGARLLYPNRLLQHGGVILGIGGVAGHNQKGAAESDPGYFNRIILPQNLSAVTAACLLVRKSIYQEVGGLDEDTLAVAFNDVDFCLKVMERGYKNIYNPHAKMFHYESATRGYETTPTKFKRFENEISTMKKRWGPLLVNDPHYNPNLTVTEENFSFAFPPRVNYPWKQQQVFATSETREQLAV